MAGLTRGPLSAEVYWRRRLLVLGLALLLVLAIARVLGAGSDASDGGSAAGSDGGGPRAGLAAQTGVPVTPAGTGTATGAAVEPPAPTPLTKKQIRQARKKQRAAEKAAAAAEAQAAAASASAAAVAALPDPLGPCADSDVVVTPTVPSAVAGSDVAIDLSLNTRFSPACSYKISADTIAVKISSGPDDIWSTQECPKAVPTQDVVLRRAVPTTVQVVWNAKRSDETCSGRTDWVDHGYYHVDVAALAGEPSDLQFELTTPVAPVVTVTADPTPAAGGRAKKKTGR